MFIVLTVGGVEVRSALAPDAESCIGVGETLMVHYRTQPVQRYGYLCLQVADNRS